VSHTLDLVKDIYARFEEGDFDGALANVSDDIVWTERIPFAGTTIGNKDEIKAMFARVGEDLDWRMQLKEFVDGGDMVVAVGTYAFRAKPHGPDEPLSHARVCHVWWLGEDGLIARYEQFVDTLKAQSIIQPKVKVRS
jgi:ketosteroid isomerase-like protein